jgi:hypothetical protein
MPRSNRLGINENEDHEHRASAINFNRENRGIETPQESLADAARQSRWESRDNQDENAPLPG